MLLGRHEEQLMLINEKTIWTPDNSYLLKYKGEIENGSIIAGQEMRMELDNLEEDLKHNDDYFYNTDSAELRMDFMERCIKLTKSPYYGQPMVLMLWQKAFIEACYSFKMTSYFKESGKVIDRFKKILLLIGRKNANQRLAVQLPTLSLLLGKRARILFVARMMMLRLRLYMMPSTL